MAVDHLGDAGLRQEIGKLWRELRRVAKATLQNASIGRAGLRVYDGGWIRIEDGGLSVTGTQIVSGRLYVSGRLEGDGVLDWTGNVYFRGPTGVQGKFAVTGPWELIGDGKITGDVEQTGTYRVLGGGKIIAGNIEITPSESGGTIKIGTHTINVSGQVLALRHSSGASLVLNNGGIAMMKDGFNVNVSENGLSFGGIPTVKSSSAGGASAGTLWRDSSGYVHRVVD